VATKALKCFILIVAVLCLWVSPAWAAWTYTESTDRTVATGTGYDFTDYKAADRTVATTACTIASGAELKAATTVGNPTSLTLTYPLRPVEYKALRLAFTTAQAGGAAVSGDETIDIYGTTVAWGKMTGVSASGQKIVPCVNLTHLFQVGDTVILIDISAPGTYETDIIASISEGISITLTNNNTNAYAAGDIVGVYQTEQINVSAAFGTYWSTVPYGQVAEMTFTGFDGTNTAKVDQPIWGVLWQQSGASQFKIDCHTDIGDGVTASDFTSKNEAVYLDTDRTFRVLQKATWTMGEKSGDWGVNGSWWHFNATSVLQKFLYWQGDNLLNIYDSHILMSGTNQVQLVPSAGDIEILNSTFGRDTQGGELYIGGSIGASVMKKTYFNNMSRIRFDGVPDTMDEIFLHKMSNVLASWGNADTTATNLDWGTITGTEIWCSSTQSPTVYIDNPKRAISSIVLAQQGIIVHE